MLKKVICILLICALTMLCCACETGDENNADTPISTADTKAPEGNPPAESTPEELTEDFVRAMYTGDLDAFFAHIPEFTYDILISMENIEVTEDTDKGAIVYDYFQSVMESEPEDVATEVTIETKISDKLNKDSYLDEVRTYYMPEGFVSEEDLEKIEDAVFVAFNADVTYANGEKRTLTDFKSALPCVKIEGKWYVDYFYLVMIPISVTPTQEQSIPVK